MPSVLKKISEKLLDQLSGTVSSDIEEAGRRNLFSIFLLLLIAPLLIFGTYLIKAGFYSYGIVDYIVAALFIIFLFLFRRVRNAKVFYRIALSLLCLLMVYWVNTGAANGYASVWVLTIPPFTFFLLGKREGVIWTVFIFGVTAAFFLFPSLSVNDFVYETGFTSRYLFTLFLIVLFTYNYESMRERYKNAMEREQHKLQEEKEMLARAKIEVEEINRLLNDEMKERKRIEHEILKHRDMLEDIVAERTNEIKNKNRELELNERKYRLLADNIKDMIWSADMTLKFTYVSPSVTPIFGYTVEEAMVLPFDKWNTPESFSSVLKIFSEQFELEKNGEANPDRHVVVELEHIKKDSTVVPVEVTVSFMRDSSGKPVGIAGITRDISERIRAQEEKEKMQNQLLQAQKMEAIGTLVSGIAHDFNNILGGIMGSFELLKRILSGENLQKRMNVDKYLDLGMESSRRSADLIKQLLSLSKKHEIHLSPIDINDSLKHIYELCRNSLPKSVELDFKISEEPLVVMGDVVQIEQVLLNFCINASHAMTIMRPEGEKQGGVLSVTAEEVKSYSLLKELHHDLPEVYGDWIKIHVADTGIGMDAETKSRIFEPFFTTKKQNEGSGLGLSISYNIVQKHGGLIHVYSEPGKGSVFSVYIPSYKYGESYDSAGICNDDIITGSGKILVIDDEIIMLNIATGFLEQCGYTVITSDNAIDGINIFHNAHNEIAAVLVDLSMPGMSGIEVYQELSRINPDVRVILASGMLDAESEKSAMNLGIMDTVNKPYMAGELSKKIKAILEKTGNNNSF